MTYKTLKKLKTFLIVLFANPKMREAIPETASLTGESGVFSIGQQVGSNVINSTVADVSKICQEMNALQVRFNKISSADFQNKSNKPWKSEVTPQEGGEDSIEVEEVDSLTMFKEMIDSKIVVMVKVGTMVRKVVMGILEIDGKAEELSEVI